MDNDDHLLFEKFAESLEKNGYKKTAEVFHCMAGYEKNFNQRVIIRAIITLDEEEGFGISFDVEITEPGWIYAVIQLFPRDFPTIDQFEETLLKNLPAFYEVVDFPTVKAQENLDKQDPF